MWQIYLHDCRIYTNFHFMQFISNSISTMSIRLMMKHWILYEKYQQHVHRSAAADIQNCDKVSASISSIVERRLFQCATLSYCFNICLQLLFIIMICALERSAVPFVH
ncbi:conserved hypothetical protein [Trichinella spiralis]|uniref:hypothetical protein n=1 Tax=Trichinella spiralis TaxID=6334 RepID=UPI0001EFEB57|nr:conserved hypothetical protein [Trichinella spiralis]